MQSQREALPRPFLLRVLLVHGQDFPKRHIGGRDNTMGILRWLGLCGVLALTMAGCAWNAVRPPTPAAHLDSASLNYAAPNERFYTLIFASQTFPRRPACTHTWATVVRTVACPGRPPTLEAHTISWLPSTLDIKPLSPCVEPGVNLSLYDAINYAQSNGERVSMWGPYECRPSFYRRFLIQKQFMESGRIGYQSFDNGGEAAHCRNGCNCIHAITDMDPEYGRANYPLIWFGDSAAEHIVNRFHERGSLFDPEVEHDWLIETLGLNCCCLVRRHYCDRLISFPRIQPGHLFLGTGS
jgi:hypothetical protein